MYLDKVFLNGILDVAYFETNSMASLKLDRNVTFKGSSLEKIRICIICPIDS